MSNNNKPVLVIMAAGMGSRYGGLKQIDPVDELGNKIIDFSIFDAVRAGFEKVVFIIKKENEQDFRSCIYNCKRSIYHTLYTEYSMCSTPWFHSALRYAKAIWNICQLLIYIFNLDMILYYISNTSLEVLKVLSFNDKNYFLKSCSYSIIY